VEHENSVDFEGHDFLRRTGSIDSDHPVNKETDTPAEPSNDRFVFVFVCKLYVVSYKNVCYLQQLLTRSSLHVCLLAAAAY
jgi:hypothetical protein